MTHRWMWFIGLVGSLLVSTAQAAEQAERESEAVRALGGPEFVEPDLLEIKFREGQRIRLRNDAPVDLEGRALRGPQAQALLRQVGGGSWRRSHSVAEEALEQLRAEGEQNTRQPLPDLNLYFRLQLPPGLDAERVAESFRELPEVEAVYRVPRPAPPPLAPDFYAPSASTQYQRYQDAAPTGARQQAGPQEGNPSLAPGREEPHKRRTSPLDWAGLLRRWASQNGAGLGGTLARPGSPAGPMEPSRVSDG